LRCVNAYFVLFFFGETVNIITPTESTQFSFSFTFRIKNDFSTSSLHFSLVGASDSGLFASVLPVFAQTRIKRLIFMDENVIDKRRRVNTYFLIFFQYESNPCAPPRLAARNWRSAKQI
jgi:hypothetical protein